MNHKIVIIGTSACGKTTLAKKLSKILKCDCTDLDDLHWTTGWKQRDPSEKIALIEKAVEKPSWVISGNYTKSASLIWPHSDMIIWLDIPLITLLFRATKRSIRRIIKKEICCSGNYETWKLFFSSKSIIIWILKTYPRRKKAYTEFFKHPKKQTLIRITKNSEYQKFMNTFQK